jgi:TonB family protein
MMSKQDRTRGHRPLVLLLALPLFVPVAAGCGRDLEIEQPRPLYGETPIEYPITLWDQGIEGETRLRVRVNEMGTVDSVQVLESSGHAEMDSAAVRGAKDLRFSPGRKNGKRIEVWAEVPVHFSRKPEQEQD